MHKLILLCGLCACAWTLSAQDGTIIQGTVTDASGEPIIGATIMASPQNGTTTDFDGRTVPTYERDAAPALLSTTVTRTGTGL